MNFKELLEGAEPKMPGAPSGIKIMTPQQFVAKAGDMPDEKDEEGVAEGEIERQHGDIKPWAYWSFPERVAKKLYQIHKGQPIGKTAIVQLWKTDGPDRMTKFMFKPDVSAILSAYQQMSEQGPLFKPGVAEGSEIQIPTEDGITMQDIRLMAGEGPLTKKTVLQAIAVIRKHRREQGVAEGSIKDVEAKIRTHDQRKADREQAGDPYVAHEIHSHNVIRKQL